MEATTARTGARKATETMPLCPDCGSVMVVRVAWRGGEVDGLYWGCRRPLVCTGTRRIKSPDSIRPISHDASSQAIFVWQQTRDEREARRPTAGGLLGMVGRMLAKPGPMAEVAADQPPVSPVTGLESLTDYGFVTLDDRRLPMARAVYDHVLFGPSGVYVVERKPWSGQISTAADAIFVDGRMRVGAIDDVVRGAAALEETLAHELKPVGATVRPAVLFDHAANKTFEAVVHKVLLGGNRSLPKAIRGTAEPVLGPETVVRLAMAADRLLE
jgi:hypothetical protein